MKFGTKLKLKKDWEYGFLTFEKGDILQVALYEHKYGLKLHHPQVSEMIDFNFGHNDRGKRLNEWFEIVEEDELLELIEQLRNINNDEANDFLKHLKRGAEAIVKMARDEQ